MLFGYDMHKFFNELIFDEIHFRDVWQFALKSDFTPVEGKSESLFTQEFYIFIPKSLKINSETYSKENFYRDQTNWIRYKTPIMSLDEVMDQHNPHSPVYRIKNKLKISLNESEAKVIEFEVKLLGNIVRSALRRTLNSIIDQLQSTEQQENTKIIADIQKLFSQTISLRMFCNELKIYLLEHTNNSLIHTSFAYIDEFISRTIDYYFCGLLSKIREKKEFEFRTVDQSLCFIISKEKEYRVNEYGEGEILNGKSSDREFILYRTGLLNKYVIDALSLSLNRSSIGTVYQNIISGFAAGIAMLVYLILLIWQGQIFLINSYPFVLITVLLYILKDRIKEWIKQVSLQQAFKWFPDYRTDIKTEDEKTVLGSLRESFAIIDENKLPKNIKTIRNKEFHQIISMFSRPENVIYYKKTITMKSRGFTDPTKHYGINIIFRFDIHHFLNKASNPKQSYLTLVPGTRKLKTIFLPKIYHLNIIMKKTYINKQGVQTTEFKKFRLIVDKNGIKNIEKVYFVSNRK